MTPELQRRWSLLAIAVVAVATALRVAEPVLAPIALAYVVALVLAPVGNFWKRFGAGPTVSASLTLALAVLALGALLFVLEPFVSNIYQQFPTFKAELRRTLADLRQSLGGLLDMKAEVQAAINPTGAVAAPADGAGDVGLPTLADAAFAAPQLAGQLLIFVGGLFFILLSRSDLYQWLATFAAHDDYGTDEMAICFSNADRQVARYFLTVSAINIGFGAAVAVTFELMGMPYALAWGIVAALANFIVYIGPAITAVALVVAGTIVFDGYAVLLPAGAFVGLNFLEGQFVTPSLIGRQLSVNPLLVFFSLTLWLWLWGPIGGIVAIPLLVWCLAVVDGLTNRPVQSQPRPEGDPVSSV